MIDIDTIHISYKHGRILKADVNDIEIIPTGEHTTYIDNGDSGLELPDKITAISFKKEIDNG